MPFVRRRKKTQPLYMSGSLRCYANLPPECPMTGRAFVGIFMQKYGHLWNGGSRIIAPYDLPAVTGREFRKRLALIQQAMREFLGHIKKQYGISALPSCFTVTFYEGPPRTGRVIAEITAERISFYPLDGQ